MFRTFQDFVAVWFAIVCFAPLLVPPGYLVAAWANVQGFRAKSFAERLLWSVALGVPVATLLAVFCGRHLSAGKTLGVFVALDAIWAMLLVWQALGWLRLRRAARRAAPSQVATARAADRWTVWTAVTVVGIALYTTLATLGITVGRKLYEGAYAGDWSVRIPLTAAAIHNAVPIPTPFYAVDGQVAALRYYYYWYALCGVAGRLGHLGARPVLAASSTWSALALIAALFLLARYLFDFSSARLNGRPRRWLYWLALPVCCVLGLDVLPAIAGLLLPKHKLYPEIEWWRSQGDFSLSFHTAVLYAPHHTAGLVCCAMGFLLLTLCARRHGSPARWQTVAWGGVLAGACFAAAVGTSTYMTVIFAIACALLMVERALARDFRVLFAVALAAAVALPLSVTYLHEILSGAGATLHADSTHIHHARFLAFFPRNVGLPRIELLQIGYQFDYRKLTPFWVKALLRPPMTLALFASELGFFGFVLARRVWLDWRAPGRLNDLGRMQWVLFAGLAFAALCLTSEPVIGVNDLGRHAGLALRFIAVLWATPMVGEALGLPWGWPLPKHRWVMRLVYASVVVGVCTQVWQVVVARSYLWLVDRGVVTHPFAPFPRFAHDGSRYFELREAFEAMNQAVTPQDHVQFNPASTYWTAMTDYLQRPVAAFDVDCEAAFGGNLERCHKAMPAIRGLFGGGKPESGPVQNFDADGVTPEAFDRVCSEQDLTAVIATASDRAWNQRESWVWKRSTMFSNRSVRVVGCARQSSPVASRK